MAGGELNIRRTEAKAYFGEREGEEGERESERAALLAAQHRLARRRRRPLLLLSLSTPAPLEKNPLNTTQLITITVTITITAQPTSARSCTGSTWP